MTHFGILCPALDGHLNPITTLGHELVMRGHRVTLFGVIDVQSRTVAAGLNFCALGKIDSSLGSVSKALARFGDLDKLALQQYMLNLFKLGIAMNLRDAPQAIQEAEVEALLIDQCIFEGETIAEVLQIPFITVCTALMLNPDLNVPTPFRMWRYNPVWWAYLRNGLGNLGIGLFALQPLLKVINEYRRQWNLHPYSILDDLWSKLAQLSQQPVEFEFPRRSLPQYFHFTGPYFSSLTRIPAAFPYEQLTGQPLIYTSLGTIQNYQKWIFQNIAEACIGMDAQLVISLGNSEALESLPKLPGTPLVVRYAPQLELLQRAALTVTHAGMNTVLESLSNGVPMVAIPLASEQPGVAARIAWTGTGEVVPPSRLSVPRLRAAIQRVLTEDSYKKNASRLQEAIRRSGGVKRAADIVEQAISTGKPVHRQKSS